VTHCGFHLTTFDVAAHPGQWINQPTWQVPGSQVAQSVPADDLPKIT